jgi:cytochrome c-type biogenesis protein CcmH
MMTLRHAVWFTAGLLITMAVAFLPRRLLPQTGAPLAFRTLKWPLFGALIVAVPILIFSAWRGASNQSRTASVSALSASRLPTETAKVHGGGSLDAMLAQLESRLRGGNGTAVDWELLAQTYDYLGRKADANNARNAHQVTSDSRPNTVDQQWPVVLQQLANTQAEQPAQKLLSAAARARAIGDYAAAKTLYEQLVATGQMNAQSWADYADVVASLNGGKLHGLPQQYIDDALQLDPTNEEALWLKASALHEGKRYALAASIWMQLLARFPPGSADAKTFAGNLAEDQRLAALSAGQDNSSAAGGAIEGSGSPARVIGEVTLSDSLKKKVSAGQTIFIVAKSVDSPGAPVAVVRTTTGQWSLRFMLDDSLAMLPERKLSTAGAVRIEARISQGGTAAIQAGDLQSTPAIVDPRSGKPVRLVIDHVIS